MSQWQEYSDEQIRALLGHIHAKKLTHVIYCDVCAHRMCPDWQTLHQLEKKWRARLAQARGQEAKL